MQEVARLSALCKRFHDCAVDAADLRAGLLGVTLAPFRGAMRLQILSIKESAAQDARSREIEESRAGAQAEWEAYLQRIFTPQAWPDH